MRKKVQDGEWWGEDNTIIQFTHEHVLTVGKVAQWVKSTGVKMVNGVRS